MEEESDGPDVVAIGRRETGTAAGAFGAGGTAATDASRGAASMLALLAGTNPLSSSLGGEQREPQEPLLPVLSKNQRHKLRQKRCRLAKRLRMQQGDSTDDPLVVADVRTPTAATAAAAAALSTAVALPLLSAAPNAGQKTKSSPPVQLLLSGGSGASTQDRVMVNVLVLGCGEREKEEAPATGATGAEAGGGKGEEEEEEEGSFPPLFQRQSRHTKFDDDDDGDDDEKDGERKLQMAGDEPRQQGKKKKEKKEEEGEKTKKRRRREDDAGDDKEAAAAAAPLPSLPSAAPCRVDLSLTAATIAVALRSSSALSSRLNSSSSAVEEEGGKRSSNATAAPRGNYPRYYGYRLSLQRKEGPSPRLLSPAHEALYGPGAADPRLRALLPYLGGLFRGRRLLDVGCNGGVLTLALAAAAGASAAVGVDADAGLVRSARARCLRLRESAAAWERGLRAGKGALEVEGREEEEGKDPPAPRFFLPEPGGRSLAGRRAAARACIRALRATTFRHEDFVAESSKQQQQQQQQQQQGQEQQQQGQQQQPEQQELFGAAVCLSVTKWIHLFHGDEGVERLFARLSRCLGKGAHLVLEPQPWRSYQRAVRKRGVREAGAAAALPLLQPQGSTSTSSQQQQQQQRPPPPPPPRSLASLRIRPEDFVSILEAPRHGFALVRSLGAPEGAAPGFDRPLLLFRKK